MSRTKRVKRQENDDELWEMKVSMARTVADEYFPVLRHDVAAGDDDEFHAEIEAHVEKKNHYNSNAGRDEREKEIERRIAAWIKFNRPRTSKRNKLRKTFSRRRRFKTI
jgi:hypothetical protein